MKYGGHPCSATSETRSCKNQACEKDCELSDWTTWSECSKDCDGGTRKRQKYVTAQPEGAGKCADRWSKDRLEYMPCNVESCIVPGPDVPLPCNRTLDIVILLDGRAGLKKEGWDKEIVAAKTFLSAFEIGKGKAEFAIFTY